MRVPLSFTATRTLGLLAINGALQGCVVCDVQNAKGCLGLEITRDLCGEMLMALSNI